MERGFSNPNPKTMKPRLIIAAILCLPAILFAQTLTPENQVISLRHIIEQTNDNAQREAALKLMANAGTYQALTYASTLLNSEQQSTAKAAAQTVWTILSTHPD